MKKIEQVYREVLYQAMEKREKRMTQLELSRTLGMSLSIVNLALKKLARVGAVRIEKMSFAVFDVWKILYLWASVRNIEKDIIYRARVEMPVREIERAMPDVAYAAYSAYKLKFRDVPADYSEVYMYAAEDDIGEIKKRIKRITGIPNLFILKKDSNLERYGKTGTLGQLFVDLWNMREWYASEFLKEMERRLKE